VKTFTHLALFKEIKMKNAGLFLGCLLVITASALQGMAQSRSQVVPEPLKVTTPTINAQRSARAWLSQPLVQVENVSNKPIEYLTIQVALPGVAEPFMLAYGQQPGKPADKNVQALRPGAKVNLSVDQHTCDVIKQNLLKLDARSLSGKQAITKISGVVFNDETAWFNGLPHVMEPNNPLHWNVVRSTTRVSKPADAPMFSFLKVGLKSNLNTEPSRLVCWEILSTDFIDCCGYQYPFTLMYKGSGEWEPLDHVTSCCTWREAVECTE
jgi:hypothetical protein